MLWHLADHGSGNWATILVMHPRPDRKVQGSRQQRSAVLAEQLFADLPDTLGESRSPIAIASHRDHPFRAGRRSRPAARRPESLRLDCSTRACRATVAPIIAENVL